MNARRGILLTTAVLVFYFPVSIVTGIPLGTTSLVMLVCSALAAIGLLSRPRRGGDTNSFPTGLTFFIVFVAIAGLFNLNQFSDFNIAMRPFLFGALVSWYFIFEARADPTGFRLMLRSVIWISTFVCVLSFYQRVTLTWPFLDDLASSVGLTSSAFGGRPGGTMGHPIIFGAISTVGMALALIIKGRFWIVPFVTCLAGLINSGSRSSFLAAGLSLAVYLVSKNRARILTSKNVARTFFVAIAVSPFLVFFSQSVADITNSISERLIISGDVSGVARSLRAETATARIFESFETIALGHGALADIRYITSFGLRDSEASTFDNFYLSLWHNFGLLALLPLIVILFVAFRSGTNGSRMVLVIFASMLFFVDITGWPSLIAIGALAAGIAQLDVGTEKLSASRS